MLVTDLGRRNDVRKGWRRASIERGHVGQFNLFSTSTSRFSLASFPAPRMG
jgi:hypothetical protein